MRQLSKSKIIAYLHCPKRLRLEIHQPALRDDSDSEAVFAIGNQVGEVARKIYDPKNSGTTIDIRALGHTEALAQSAALLAEGKSPKALAGRRKRLFIDGLGGSLETARQALSDDEEILRLDRLTKISKPAARALAGHRGPLFLNGLSSHLAAAGSGTPNR